MYLLRFTVIKRLKNCWTRLNIVQQLHSHWGSSHILIRHWGSSAQDETGVKIHYPEHFQENHVRSCSGFTQITKLKIIGHALIPKPITESVCWIWHSLPQSPTWSPGPKIWTNTHFGDFNPRRARTPLFSLQNTASVAVSFRLACCTLMELENALYTMAGHEPTSKYKELELLVFSKYHLEIIHKLGLFASVTWVSAHCWQNFVYTVYETPAEREARNHKNDHPAKIRAGPAQKSTT